LENKSEDKADEDFDFDFDFEDFGFGDEVEYTSEEVMKVADLVRKGRIVAKAHKTETSLYKLDIPDKIIHKLLDWNKPFSKQTTYVKNALKKVKTLGWSYNELLKNNVAGYDIYYKLAKAFKGSDIAASEHLASIGIPGNKHLDGKTTYNYVIWDQKVLDQVALLERNGEKIRKMQFQAEQNKEQSPRQQVTPAQVKNWFTSKGQTTGIDKDGNVFVRTEGGLGIQINFVKKISDTDYEYAVNTGQMSKNGNIAGKAEGNTITLSTDYAKYKTIAHEVVHALEKAGVITHKDSKVLNTKINALNKKGKLTFDLQTDKRENRANFLSQVLEDREQYRGTRIGAILQKIADFLDALVHVGRTSTRKIARSIESGKIFAKDAGQAQDSEVNYNALPGYSPKKTKKSYKLFRTLKTKTGLYPLFIGKTKETEQGKWIEAEFLSTKGFADRPGWHSGILPIAPHLRQKSTGKISPDRVWAEIEIPDDVDWQQIADKSRTRDIRNEVPKDGSYKFKTNKMQGGAWNISGAIKINKVLSDTEVNTLLKEAGYSESDISECILMPCHYLAWPGNQPKNQH
jgi:hypothetical protein